ncbi:MAG: DUF460 domain-containing protein [Candidatus Aenigmarchaeota archaeon]|nr:DUF460 domain-containing protein [Candidatus Aenigmarchaeota archaeon]
MPKLIVGIDPGDRTGLAAVDIKTGEIFLATRVGGEIEEDVVMKIAELGDPVIIASDTSRVSKRVWKTAKSFNARIWKPRHNIPVYEKIRLTKKIKTGNSHERDALAAALCAKNHYSNLFRKIEKKMRMHGMEELSESVKEMVVRQKVSIAKAVAMVQN